MNPSKVRLKPDATQDEQIRRSLAYLAAPGAHDVVAVVTEVTLTRLTGVALMKRPLITTVWSLWAGMLNSKTPIRRNSFFPAGGVVGTSFGGGAFALLGTGSVALTSVHVFGADSRRQPVTLTISTFGVGAA